MTRSVVNQIITRPPDAGHTISFTRLGGTQSMDLRRLHDLAGGLAAGLSAAGVGPGDRIGILAANSLEWVLLDLAALRLGAQTAGFEPGSFDPDPALLTRYGLRLLFTDKPPWRGRILPMTEARRLAEQACHDDLPRRARWKPKDATTIKFTSGSTGTPKGLGATAGSIDSSINAVQGMFSHRDGDRLFVFLPLSLLQQRYWIYSALCFGHDIAVSTYEAAFTALRRTQPTVVMGVPGFYQAMRRRIETRAASAGPVSGNPVSGNPVSGGHASRGPAAREPVLREAAERVFGTRIRYLWTGSAPAGLDTLEFFTGLGMPIYEGYGLNEACIVSKNYPGACRPGSVGRVLPGKEVVIDPAGGLIVRSEHPVNWRYEYAAEGESERMFTPDGVRTGDVGRFDSDGFLYIQGRADNMAVLESGKNVMLGPIERHLAASPAISDCVLYCPDNRYLVAVVSPAARPPDTGAIAEQAERTRATLGHGVQLRKVIVVRDQFSTGNGLLSGQFKPRRKAILAACGPQIHDSDPGDDGLVVMDLGQPGKERVP